MKNLVPICICLGLFWCIYKIIEVCVRRKERMAIIEKLGIAPDSIVPARRPLESNYTWLRAAAAALGFGLGMIAGSIIINRCQHINESILFSAALAGCGLMLVIEFIIEYILHSKETKKQE